MAGLREWMDDLADGVDQRLLHHVYAAVSAPPDRIRATWRRAGWAFLDPGRREPPLAELDHTADKVIAQASLSATAIGGLAGLGGLASVPPEVAATAVAMVRLAQRLALVYGFDPNTDRGKMAVWRAIAAGLELQLPEGGATALRVRDLPRVLLGAAPPPHRAGAAMARGVFLSALRMVGGRVSRFVPVLSSGAAAASGRSRTLEAGQRMKGVLRRMAEAPLPAEETIEDAVEVA